LAEINPISAFIKESLAQKKYSKIKVYFNYYINTMNQVFARFKLYPLDEKSFESFLETIGLKMDLLESIDNKYLIVEPDVETFKFDFIQLLIRTIIFSAVLNNKTTEYAARMIAMKNAKDNCSDLLAQLNLLYNKTRQYKITQEINEIV
jgi:F-type H+-transporting ATPase subunit gamma